jgi:hypothetical protein
MFHVSINVRSFAHFPTRHLISGAAPVVAWHSVDTPLGNQPHPGPQGVQKLHLSTRSTSCNEFLDMWLTSTFSRSFQEHTMGYFQYAQYDGLLPVRTIRWATSNTHNTMGYFQYAQHDGLLPIRTIRWATSNTHNTMGYFQYAQYDGLLPIRTIRWATSNTHNTMGYFQYAQYDGLLPIRTRHKMYA